ncbi:MAG: hypothetical protein ACI8ZO_001657 [Flavobacteriales bacterium]|jgi:hypothetical protein
MKTLFILCNTANEITSWSADRILVFTAIIISILSLIISVLFNRKTLNMTIDHNKKSVIPAITFHRREDADDKSFSLSISNSGLGPAIITNISFAYKSETYSDIFTLLEKNTSISKEDFEKTGMLVSILDHREALATGKDEDIYSVKFTNDINYQTGKEIFKKTECVIQFEDLYNSTFKKRCIINNLEF